MLLGPGAHHGRSARTSRTYLRRPLKKNQTWRAIDGGFTEIVTIVVGTIFVDFTGPYPQTQPAGNKVR